MNSETGVPLPTFASSDWSIADFQDSLKTTLDSDISGTDLKLYFYSVSLRGWNIIEPLLKRWAERCNGRCIAYVGVDHGITDPDALDKMQKSVSLRLMIEYQGVFHPKVIWLKSNPQSIWVGSSNLSDGGLRQNIECGIKLSFSKTPPSFEKWTNELHDSSTPATASLISEYRSERDRFAKEHLTGGLFTWSKRREPPPKSSKQQKITSKEPIGYAIPKRCLIVEVMPRETGPGGKQLQLPIVAAARFFGLSAAIGSSRVVELESAYSGDTRRLTMTVYRNSTIRLSLNELDYSDRPCVIVFTRQSSGAYRYEIVQRAMWPDRYNVLVNACNQPTRSGSRRWLLS